MSIWVHYSARCDQCAGVYPRRYEREEELVTALEGAGWIATQRQTTCNVCNGNYHGGN
jgi:hypothetical protein